MLCLHVTEAVILLSLSIQKRLKILGGRLKGIILMETGTSSTCPVCSHSLVCYKDSSYFVGINTLYKQDIFQVCGKWKNIVPWMERGIDYQKQVCGVHKTCSI